MLVSTFAGNGSQGYQDGDRINSKFNFPCGVAIDWDGNIIIADCNNNRIRKINSIGVVTTVAGNGTRGYQDGGIKSKFDIPFGYHQDSDRFNSKFDTPIGVTIDKDRNLITADCNNNRIRKINSIGVVTTIAGKSRHGYQDGNGIKAKFYNPRGVTIDQDRNIFVADSANHRIRKICANGFVTTVAGKGTQGYQDGSGINSAFNNPDGIAIVRDGNIFVADCGNHRIRKVCASGVVTTVAGDGTQGYQDGSGLKSKFNYPCGLAIDKKGNIFIADSKNHRIRKLSSDGVVSTVAGDGTPGFKDGINPILNFPTGIAIDKDSFNIFITDRNNHRIRQINFQDKIITKWPSTHSLLRRIFSEKDIETHIFSLLFIFEILF